MEESEKKYFAYAQILGAKISEAIEEIGKEDIKENLTEFFHALANVTPNLVYNQIMWKKLNALEFNHFANHLVFQYSKLSETDEYQ